MIQNRFAEQKCMTYRASKVFLAHPPLRLVYTFA